MGKKSRNLELTVTANVRSSGWHHVCRNRKQRSERHFFSPAQAPSAVHTFSENPVRPHWVCRNGSVELYSLALLFRRADSKLENINLINSTEIIFIYC